MPDQTVEEVVTMASEGYCMKCRAKREIQGEKQTTLKNGRPAIEGTCPVCGTKMVKMVSKANAG
jgi:hypothetical protein